MTYAMAVPPRDYCPVAREQVRLLAAVQRQRQENVAPR